jgi:hypothetical protein
MIVMDCIRVLLALSELLFRWWCCAAEDAFLIIVSFATFPVASFSEELLYGEVQSKFDYAAYCRSEAYFLRGLTRAVVVGWCYFALFPWYCALVGLTFTVSFARQRGYLVLDKFDYAGTPVLGSLCRKIRCWLHSFSEFPRDYAEAEFRMSFHQHDLPVCKPSKTHTHPNAAAARSSACAFASSFAIRNGCDIFSVQRSAHDVRQGIPGNRVPYWAKDLGVTACENAVGTNPMFYYQDVDYHIPDFEGVLANNFAPTLLYTVLPTFAAGTDNEDSFCFLDDGSMRFVVTGGAIYEHKIYDYNCDSLVVTSWYLGCPYWTSVYKVERRHVTQHRGLVFLVPVARWFGVLGYFARFLYRSKLLDRFNPVNNGFVRVDCKEEKKHTVSIARVGDFTSATIDVSNFENAQRAFSVTDPKYVSIHSISTWMPQGLEMKSLGSSLYEYFLSNPPRRGNFVSKYVPPPMRVYSANTTFGEDPEKPCMTPFMAPIDPNVYVPSKHEANAHWAVKTRVVELQAKQGKNPETLSSNVIGFFRDFVGYFAPNNAVLVPKCDVQLFENQTRPTQQRLLRVGVSEGNSRDFTDPLSTFQKAEPYADPKDPRVITTLPSVEKVDISAFPMAITDYLKTFIWYAFVKPFEICGRIAAAALGALFAVELDISRMDGNTGHVPREYVHIPVYMRLFRYYRGRVAAYFHSILKRTAIIADKFWYKTDLSTLSGGPGTSTDNTIIGASLTYTTARCLKMNHEEAVKLLNTSMFGGDDAVTFFHKDIPRDKVVEAYQAAANIYGYPIKIKLVERGGFVSFLGRFYCPWTGDTSSISDVPRQMRKLHLTVGMVTHPVIKALEKARSYVLTDANTPILGDWARKVVDLYGEKHPDVLPTRERWWAQYRPEDQFNNEPRDWHMQCILEQYEKFDFARFHEALAKNDPLNMPICVPEMDVAAATFDVVINGELVKGARGALVDTEPGKDGKHRVASKENRTTADAGGETDRAKQRPLSDPERPGAEPDNAKLSGKAAKRRRGEKKGSRVAEAPVANPPPARPQSNSGKSELLSGLGVPGLTT